MLGAAKMKPKGRHPEKKLTTLKVNRLSEPGRYADGNGLYLIVDVSGAKRWMLRTVVQGKRCDIGLGGVSLVSLAEAREQAQAMRKLARANGNPLLERHRAKQIIPTFEKAAKLVYEARASSWRNDKHRTQWINTLRDYAFPKIGSKRVDLIGTADILEVLSPIWLTKAETARRLRQRLGTVMDWAKAAGHRSGDNPVEGVTKGLPKQDGRKDHHGAIPYSEIAAFLERLDGLDMSRAARLAFKFLILSACRTNEVLGARWEEVCFDKAIWEIPPARMKGKRRQTVPLSSSCLMILHEAKTLAGTSELVFPGRIPTKPLSNMVFLMAMRRMGFSAVPHGFRSTFRDWASEQTSFPNEVCEMALAHAIRDKTEAAYRRGDLLTKRRDLMEAWSTFCMNNLGQTQNASKICRSGAW
jgi:integrase